jgi:hypothetical protein
VRQSLCGASGGGAHDKKWSMCHEPPEAHGKRTILAAVLGQFAVRLTHSAWQIDLIFFYFFLFFTSKNSPKRNT